MRKRKSIPVEESFVAWRRDPAYVKAYAALAEEFALAAALIEARARVGLSQEDVAKKMRTSQSAIARLEGGQGNPSLDTLRRFAKATGSRLQITFERPQARLPALDTAIARGLADANAGRVTPLSHTFDRLQAKYRSTAKRKRR
jgi:transcriptional regulator with XRE-family HTH domain